MEANNDNETGVAMANILCFYTLQYSVREITELRTRFPLGYWAYLMWVFFFFTLILSKQSNSLIMTQVIHETKTVVLQYWPHLYPSQSVSLSMCNPVWDRYKMRMSGWYRVKQPHSWFSSQAISLYFWFCKASAAKKKYKTSLCVVKNIRTFRKR